MVTGNSWVVVLAALLCAPLACGNGGNVESDGAIDGAADGGDTNTDGGGPDMSCDELDPFEIEVQFQGAEQVTVCASGCGGATKKLTITNSLGVQINPGGCSTLLCSTCDFPYCDACPEPNNAVQVSGPLQLDWARKQYRSSTCGDDNVTCFFQREERVCAPDDSYIFRVCVSVAVPGTAPGSDCETAEILCTEDMTAPLHQADSVQGTIIIPPAYH